MTWSGGTYKKGNFTTNGWTGDASLGIGIEAGRHDTQDDDFATGINQCLNKDGSNAATGNLNAGAFRVTNLGAGTARTDAAQVAQVQDGTSSYLGTTGGTSTAFTVTATPTITALVTGAQYSFKANAANGVAATLKIDGTTATTMQRQGTALVGNEFKANDFVSVVYDNTNFQITNIATAPLYVDRTNNRVGIGTTAPVYDFEVAGTATRSQITRFSADTVGTQFDLAKSRGATVGTNTIVQSGDILGAFRFAGANGTGFSEAASIAGLCDGTPGATNDMPGRIAFYTTADGAGTATERMRISSNGTVGIGGASRNASTKLDVKGIIACGSGTSDAEVSWTRPTVADSPAWNMSVRTDVGGSNEDLKVLRFISGAFVDIPIQVQSTTGFVGLGTAPSYRLHLSTDSAAKPTTNTWTISSDARIKTNVQPYSKGLTEICQVEPITYDYNGKGGIAAGPGGVSILAQDLQPIFPECVSSYKGKLNENDTLETDILNYNGHAITFALINAVKELNAKVEALEARIAALEA